MSCFTGQAVEFLGRNGGTARFRATISFGGAGVMERIGDPRAWARDMHRDSRRPDGTSRSFVPARCCLFLSRRGGSPETEGEGRVTRVALSFLPPPALQLLLSLLRKFRKKKRNSFRICATINELLKWIDCSKKDRFFTRKLKRWIKA